VGVFCGPFVPYLIPAITEEDDCSSGGEGGKSFRIKEWEIEI